MFINSFWSEAVLLPWSWDKALQQNIEDQYMIMMLVAFDNFANCCQFYIIFEIYPESLEPGIEISFTCCHAMLAYDAINEMGIRVYFENIFKKYSQ